MGPEHRAQRHKKQCHKNAELGLSTDAPEDEKYVNTQQAVVITHRIFIIHLSSEQLIYIHAYKVDYCCTSTHTSAETLQHADFLVATEQYIHTRKSPASQRKATSVTLRVVKFDHLSCVVAEFRTL